MLSRVCSFQFHKKFFLPSRRRHTSYFGDWSSDVCSSDLPRGYYTTASMDGGTANNGDTWNEQGYFAANATVGLPPAGSTMTSLADANHQYRFAPDYKADRKSTRLNSSHRCISYAVFCLKK